MASKNRPFVIALEEHYWDAEVAKNFEGEGRNPELRKRLDDVGALRIKEMDEAGIDVQVLSHGAPSTQRVEAASAVPLARRANDRLHEAVRAHPDRFAGFAALPTADPKAAADELERAVGKLGFKGAMVHGPTNGVFFDDKRFWPIFERAQALDVPLYLHPSLPMKAVVDAYYGDYLGKYPQLQSAAWGYTVETATQGIRMVLSGVFEKYPGLKIILGHLGESLPFSAWRIDMCLSRGVQPAFLDHHERQLLHPGADVLHHGNGRRPDTVLGGLPLRAQPARNEVDGGSAAQPRGPDEDPLGQLQAAAEDVARCRFCGSFQKTRARAGGPARRASLRHDGQRVGGDGEFHDVQVPEHRYRAGDGFGRASGQRKGGEQAQDNRDRQTEFGLHDLLYSKLRADPEWKRPLADIDNLKQVVTRA